MRRSVGCHFPFISQVVQQCWQLDFVTTEPIKIRYSSFQLAISELPFASVSKRVLVHNLCYGNEFYLHVHCYANQTKGRAPGLVLKQRQKATRKVSKVIAELLWFCFTTLHHWFNKLAPPAQPIRCKTKTLYLLRVLIGSLCCFRLLWWPTVIALGLVLRHSIENRSRQTINCPRIKYLCRFLVITICRTLATQCKIPNT